MFKHFSNDLPAGLIVFLVAVPLCLGIALASGAPLFSGIIAGIVGGIVVGLISGSKIGVSGPAAGLTVIVADAIIRLGTDANGIFDMERGFPLFLSAVVLAGIIQIGLAFAKSGIIGYYFPNSVIKGMLTAIGVIIILKQIPHALGHDVIAEGFDGFWQKDGENSFTELMIAFGDINPAALLVTSVSMFVLILWEQNFMKKIKIFNIIQGPLVVVTAGILFTRICLDIDIFSFEKDEMVGIPLMTDQTGFSGLFTTPDWSMLFNSDLWIIAFTIAVVASLETLLCVDATDKMDPEKNVTPTNRELIAQGAGNIASGLVGGLPVTQVIVRSSANMQSGGKTKLAAMIHGLFIAISVFLLPDILNMIPLSSLAAILIMVGYKLAKPSIFKEMAGQGRDQLITFLITFLGIVFTDLLMGIGIGLAVGFFMILRKNFNTPFSYTETFGDGEPIEIILSDNVTFLNKASILQALNAIPNQSAVIIDATSTHYIHPDVIEIIDDFIVKAKQNDISIEIKGDFHEVNKDHLDYFLKKVSKDGNHKTPYFETIFKN